MNALDLSKALEEVYFLARTVKAKTADTKIYIESQDALAKGPMLVLSADQKELWKITIENLVQTLDVSSKKCTELKKRLEDITKDITVLKSTITSMVTTSTVKVNAEVDKL